MSPSRAGHVTGDGSRLLIVNADDYGLTDKVSRAILQAHRDGIVTSTSVLTLSPAFETSRALAARRAPARAPAPTWRRWVRTRRCSARPRSPRWSIGKGRLRLSWRQFLPRAAAGRIDPDDLRREFGAQIERILAAGLTIDHLDTHQNLHLWPMVARRGDGPR